MADGKALFIQNGIFTQLTSSDTLQLSNIDTAASGTLIIGGTVATGVNVGTADAVVS
jgi:hypothetical protein